MRHALGRAQTVDVADMFAKMTEVAAATAEEGEGDANATPDPDTPHTFLGMDGTALNQPSRAPLIVVMRQFRV